MSAEPIDRGARPWSPDPVRQRMADFTIEDVLAIPDDAPRVELVDGVMAVVPSPSLDHQAISNLLWAWLRKHRPHPLDAATAVGVAVSLNNTCEPDVLLHWAEIKRTRHFLMPHEVLLVVEVVSPGTRRRDRLEKPAVYAEAGIPNFWRIEQDPVHVYAYTLKDGAYVELANSADELVVDEPFPIRLPIREITP
ncbi:Uma2 family endonuclease [Planosporangium flavigriseum]|nr:Uma2 family endonuclease [Planosporangium flavigriseum]NJC65290.1 Uma2 family endonuclease [Planosporangium flavigriseum]